MAELRRYREEYRARFGNNQDLTDQERERSAARWPNKRVSYSEKDDKCAPPTDSR